MKTTQIIEALLFASDAPLSAEDLIRGEEDLVPEDVVAAVDALRAEYEERGRAFQIYEIAGGYQLLTRPEYSPHLERFETVPQSTRVSSAALEVLAIIAYRQPLGRMEVEDIRGVGSSHVLRTLQELGLIDVVGRGEGLGRPLLYGTTDRFLDHFGFTSLDDLPKPDELPVILAEATASAEDAEWEVADLGPDGSDGPDPAGGSPDPTGAGTRKEP
jgi:segregation and condensation protein B